MKLHKLIASAIASALVVSAIPALSLAEGVVSVAGEAKAMSKLDTTWEALTKVEQNALASGMNRNQVINAVHQAALNLPDVDKAGFQDFTKDGFFFTVDGMCNSYNYRLRNELDTNVEPIPENEKTVFVKGRGATGTTVADAESPNVFLIGPYYGHDASFTDQYKTEAQSIADATGGDYTLIQSTNATGPAIAENYPDKGVIIYDSHGIQTGTSSYLCLTTSAGITQEDYANGWAVRDGNAAFIDGRYIENHVNDNLSNPIVWMAICEGMKRGGQGTTGHALLRAGAGAVYGYSQEVTFAGDYKYEAEFWTHMKDGETVAESFNAMVARWGDHDPHGDAYPIVMSPDDDFPANPDSHQIVNCDWILFGNPEPVELTNFGLSENSVEVYIGRTVAVNFIRIPENANQYELQWSCADESIATIKGNNRRVNITGIGIGSTSVTCTVNVDGQVMGTATVAVTVDEDTTLRDALNVDGGTLAFSTGSEYPFEAVNEGDRYYAKSTNQNSPESASTLTTVIKMEEGETLSFDYKYSSETNYDWYNFSVNDQRIQHLSGTNANSWKSYTYTAPTAGTYTFVWEFTKDISVNDGDDCVKIDNVAYSGDQGQNDTADGDLDGDSSVSVRDALIAMRIAMGIMEPTEAMLAHGDLDGNGLISLTEALEIMRMAMLAN